MPTSDRGRTRFLAAFNLPWLAAKAATKDYPFLASLWSPARYDKIILGKMSGALMALSGVLAGLLLPLLFVTRHSSGFWQWLATEVFFFFGLAPVMAMGVLQPMYWRLRARHGSGKHPTLSRPEELFDEMLPWGVCAWCLAFIVGTASAVLM